MTRKATLTNGIGAEMRTVPTSDTPIQNAETPCFSALPHQKCQQNDTIEKQKNYQTNPLVSTTAMTRPAQIAHFNIHRTTIYPCARLPASTPLFCIPSGLARILDRDLAVAGIPKRDERNRVVDVHALRVTFGTHLCAAGVPLRTAQTAMRHSKPELTANIYTDPKLLDIAGAINSLPALSMPSPTLQTKAEVAS